MEGGVSPPFSVRDVEREGHRSHGSVSPLSRNSSERKQHHVETDMPQDHHAMLEQSGTDKLGKLSEKTSKPGRRTERWSRFATDRWIWELCAMLMSLSSLVAIVLVLRLHDGRPLPDWPFSITINSLVSIFSTIMGFTLLVPIAEGISQAKWHWFQQYRALRDVEVYDQASRGPWGSLKMLWGIRWRWESKLLSFWALGY